MAGDRNITKIEDNKYSLDVDEVLHGRGFMTVSCHSSIKKCKRRARLVHVNTPKHWRHEIRYRIYNPDGLCIFESYNNIKYPERILWRLQWYPGNMKPRDYKPFDPTQGIR